MMVMRGGSVSGSLPTLSGRAKNLKAFDEIRYNGKGISSANKIRIGWGMCNIAILKVPH